MARPRTLEQDGSGQEFPDAYEKKLRQLMRFPESAPLIRNEPSGSELRSFLLRGFRHPLIVGVAHTSREPGYWRDRVT